jgi:hypothetical protein
MRLDLDEPGRATPEEIFVTVLSWMELVEEIGTRFARKSRLPAFRT